MPLGEASGGSLVAGASAAARGRASANANALRIEERGFILPKPLIRRHETTLHITACFPQLLSSHSQAVIAKNVQLGESSH